MTTRQQTIRMSISSLMILVFYDTSVQNDTGHNTSMSSMHIHVHVHVSIRMGGELASYMYIIVRQRVHEISV